MFKIEQFYRKKHNSNAIAQNSVIHHSTDSLKQYRRTSQAAAAPPDSGKPIIFRAKAKIFGQRPAAKSGFFFGGGRGYLLNEKKGIHSVQRDKVPKIRDFY